MSRSTEASHCTIWRLIQTHMLHAVTISKWAQMAANDEQLEQLRHENKMLKEELNSEIEAAKCACAARKPLCGRHLLTI